MPRLHKEVYVALFTSPEISVSQGNYPLSGQAPRPIPARIYSSPKAFNLNFSLTAGSCS